jgi:TetR/AcrR family transcriptional regulator, regulator of autoinduction and epiphytic fitness
VVRVAPNGELSGNTLGLMKVNAAPVSGSPITDGRSLRAARTRQLVVGTILDLLNEGVAQPTAQQVSDRSGVSMSSIFRLFEDIEALFVAAVTAQIERIAPLFEQLSADGPLTKRVDRLISSRSRVFEAISPVRRMAVRLASTSPTIAAFLHESDAHFRREITTVLGIELGRIDRARRSTVVSGLDAACSWELWERLRQSQQLSVSQSSRVVRSLVNALLED